MSKKTGPTNYQVQKLIEQLQEKSVQSRFWKRVMKDLLKPTRQRRTVNLYKINKMAKEGELIIVPGKVLSVGDVNKSVQVAALTFSKEAKRKIEEANGKTLSISELLQQNPDGKKVRIIG